MTEDVRHTHYLPGEGRAYMRQCLGYAFARCSTLGLRHVVVFTGTGEGALFALQELLPKPEHAEIELVAVTPPVGRAYKLDPRDQSSPVIQAGLSSELRDFLTKAGVVVVSGHMPFKPIGGPDGANAAMTALGEVLAILGGGFPLCVQAALMACDAGAIAVGERIVVASGDTAVTLMATRTETFLSRSFGMIVDEFICRPSEMTISKSQNVLAAALRQPPLDQPSQIETSPAPLLADKSDE